MNCPEGYTSQINASSNISEKNFTVTYEVFLVNTYYKLHVDYVIYADLSALLIRSLILEVVLINAAYVFKTDARLKPKINICYENSCTL